MSCAAGKERAAGETMAKLLSTEEQQNATTGDYACGEADCGRHRDKRRQRGDGASKCEPRCTRRTDLRVQTELRGALLQVDLVPDLHIGTGAARFSIRRES
jgi:hypothetical protein